MAQALVPVLTLGSDVMRCLGDFEAVRSGHAKQGAAAKFRAVGAGKTPITETENRSRARVFNDWLRSGRRSDFVEILMEYTRGRRASKREGTAVIPRLTLGAASFARYRAATGAQRREARAAGDAFAYCTSCTEDGRLFPSEAAG
ncbi:hypothetical protein MRX96_010650 [Rhipicephalus microplus]